MTLFLLLMDFSSITCAYPGVSYLSVHVYVSSIMEDVSVFSTFTSSRKRTLPYSFLYPKNLVAPLAYGGDSKMNWAEMFSHYINRINRSGKANIL